MLYIAIIGLWVFVFLVDRSLTARFNRLHRSLNIAHQAIGDMEHSLSASLRAHARAIDEIRNRLDKLENKE